MTNQGTCRHMSQLLKYPLPQWKCHCKSLLPPAPIRTKCVKVSVCRMLSTFHQVTVFFFAWEKEKISFAISCSDLLHLSFEHFSSENDIPNAPSPGIFPNSSFHSHTGTLYFIFDLSLSKFDHPHPHPLSYQTPSLLRDQHRIDEGQI